MVQANYVEIEGVCYSANHPKVIAARQRLAGLPDTEREPRAIPALEHRQEEHRGRKKRVVVVVTIISYRLREIDSDNLCAGAKGLRDAVAKSLGVDDGDKRIRWEYRNIVTTGAVGTHVLIQAK